MAPAAVLAVRPRRGGAIGRSRVTESFTTQNEPAPGRPEPSPFREWPRQREREIREVIQQLVSRPIQAGQFSQAPPPSRKTEAARVFHRPRSSSRWSSNSNRKERPSGICREPASLRGTAAAIALTIAFTLVGPGRCPVRTLPVDGLLSLVPVFLNAGLPDSTLVESSPGDLINSGRALAAGSRNDLKSPLLVVIPLARPRIWLATTPQPFRAALCLTNVFRNSSKPVQPPIRSSRNLINLGSWPVGAACWPVLLIGLMARKHCWGAAALISARGNPAAAFPGRLPSTNPQQLLETVFGTISTPLPSGCIGGIPARKGPVCDRLCHRGNGAALQSDFPEPMLSVFIPPAPNPPPAGYAVVPEPSVRDIGPLV